MDKHKPIKSQMYNDDWLNSAWGDSANQSLLSGDAIIARPRITRAIELANITPNTKLLDIACGRGEFPILSSYQGAQSIGIDYSIHALKLANQVKDVHKTKLPHPSSIQFIQADATSLPFPDNSFDRITMLDIIEHLTPHQLEQMFIEVRRILKPEGYAVIHTLPNRWVYNFTFPLLNKISRKFPKDPRGPYDSIIHINEQSLPSLHKTLKKCGLNQHLWLEQHMASQARWNSGKDTYGDNRDDLYPLLSGFWGRILELLSFTPLKLILSNDIFGILWKSSSPPKQIKLTFKLTEKLTTLF